MASDRWCGSQHGRPVDPGRIGGPNAAQTVGAWLRPSFPLPTVRTGRCHSFSHCPRRRVGGEGQRPSSPSLTPSDA